MSESFSEFLSCLKPTNRNLGFFTDFEKVEKNKKEISIHLNQLNYLLGKKELEEEVKVLFERNKECFSVLNILIAVRNSNEEVLSDDKTVSMKDYFQNAEKIYQFLKETGLEDLFKSQKVKNLEDYVFGIEVGLDSNARKNRTGKFMERKIEEEFLKRNISFKKEVKSSEFLGLNIGKDKKRFDFVVRTKKKIYLIETNFYNGGGSKLNEIARSYGSISERIKGKEFEFVWITDGNWKSAKLPLKEAFGKISKIYNLTTFPKFLKKIESEEVLELNFL